MAAGADVDVAADGTATAGLERPQRGGVQRFRAADRGRRDAGADPAALGRGRRRAGAPGRGGARRDRGCRLGPLGRLELPRRGAADRAGGTPEEATRTLSGSGQDAMAPQVDVAPDGEATVVWKRFDGFHYLVQVRRIAADGTSEGARSGSRNPARTRSNRAVAVADDGTATVVWSRFDGSDSIVQARRVEPGGSLGCDHGPLGAGRERDPAAGGGWSRWRGDCRLEPVRRRRAG